MGNLFKGVHLLTQSEYNTLSENEQLDPDVLYATPENVTELVRLHTEQISENSANIARNKEDIESLKKSPGGSSEDIVEIKNTINEIILRDNTQDNRLLNIEEKIATDVVDLASTQTITGPKTFTEHIYLVNSDGTVDRISHLNNNFIIHSGATNSAVLNIDEGLKKIYAFNNELAFKSDIAEASGTTVYVDGAAVASLSFSADPQTQINLLAESIDDNTSDLTTIINTKVSKSGDTMTGELIASGGIKFGNNKINSENSGNTLRTYHIENNEEYDILNYTHGGMLTVNNANTPLILQGYDDRPTYVSGSGVMSDFLLENDIPTWVKQPNKPEYDFSEIKNTPDVVKFYAHYISAYDASIFIITDNNTPFTYSTLARYLYDNGFRDAHSSGMVANGPSSSGTYWFSIYKVASSNGTEIQQYKSNGGTIGTSTIDSSRNFSDIVVAIN